MNPTIVSGVVSTVTELGKDEAWLQGWLKEQPERLGLGELEVADTVSDTDDDRSFAALDEDRCFSVDVQLGEMEASRGFGVLDYWARNRILHPDKTHVAVLVTEVIDDRYRHTLETLAEHLPIVVVELQVWRGESEAIVVPHLALTSDDVDLGTTPAAKAAEAIAKTAEVDEPAEVQAVESEDEPESDAEAKAEPADELEVEVPENKDDTGVADPWGLPAKEPEPVAAESNGEGSELLSKIGV